MVWHENLAGVDERLDRDVGLSWTRRRYVAGGRSPFGSL